MSEDFDLGPAVADATNVMLVAPGVGDTADQLCCDVMTAEGEIPEHVVGVSITDSPGQKVSTWRERLGPEPALSMLGIDGVTRAELTADVLLDAIRDGSTRVEGRRTPIPTSARHYAGAGARKSGFYAKYGAYRSGALAKTGALEAARMLYRISPLSG